MPSPTRAHRYGRVSMKASSLIWSRGWKAPKARPSRASSTGTNRSLWVEMKCRAYDCSWAACTDRSACLSTRAMNEHVIDQYPSKGPDHVKGQLAEARVMPSPELMKVGFSKRLM